ncbi:MAG: hypothetical protein KA185_16700, partial [Vitreoscilla sp.]|nr:hypothetical protein [Vitreoscilla sp.]
RSCTEFLYFDACFGRPGATQNTLAEAKALILQSISRRPRLWHGVCVAMGKQRDAERGKQNDEHGKDPGG